MANEVKGTMRDIESTLGASVCSDSSSSSDSEDERIRKRDAKARSKITTVANQMEGT